MTPENRHAPLSPLAVIAAVTGFLALPLLPSFFGTAAMGDFRDPARPRRGLSLARLGIALGIFWFLVEAVLAAVFIVRPDVLLAPLFGERIAAGHSSAEQALLDIARQQDIAKKEDEDQNGIHDYWSTNIAGLYRMAMDRKGHPEEVGADVAAADAGDSEAAAAVPRDGYVVQTVAGVDRVIQFAATAYPSRYAVDGLRTYYIDERGVLWWKDLGGLPADRRRESPEQDGWEKAETR